MEGPTAGIAAAVFDCDGVLVDSEPLHAETWVEVLSRLGIRLDRRWFDRWIGVPDSDLAGYLSAEMGLALPPEEIVGRKRDAYRAAVEAGRLRAFPGVEEGVDRLRSRGIRLAVASNGRSEAVRQSLRRCGLLDRFPCLVGVEEVENGKPAPDLYLEAARRLGTPPGMCVVVEDSPAGVRAARAAGCRVLAVATSLGAGAVAEAEAVFPSTAEAIEAIGRMAGIGAG